MKKIIIDTNVLLSGLFSPGSFSRRALEKALNKDIIGHISKNSRYEALTRLKEAYEKTGIDLRSHLVRSLNNPNLVILPRVSARKASEFDKIKGLEDMAICYHAKNRDLTVCTNDIHDFSKADHYGVYAITPFNLVYSIDGLDLRYAFTGVLAGPKKGTFYVDIGAPWSGFCSSHHNKLMAIFDIEGIGGLYFLPNRCQFTFFADGGPNASANLKIEHIEVNRLGDEEIQIVVSYDSTQGITVYLNYRGTQGSVTQSWTPCNYHARSFTMFNGRKGNFGTASFRTFASFPNPCTERRANNLMAKKSVSSPLDSLSVEEMIAFNFTSQ